TIGAARLGCAERVDLQPHVLDSEQAPQPCAQGDQLRIDIRTGKADRFDIELVELTVAARLWRFMAEHRTYAPELVPLAAEHAVGNERADHSGGRFRAQGEALASLRLERVHLLTDNIGELADRALEECGGLDERYTHLLVAIGAHELGDAALEKLPGPDLRRRDVVHPANGLDLIRQAQSPLEGARVRATRPERLTRNSALPSGCAILAMEVPRPSTSTATPAALASTTRR